jgi:tripartite ATP-independent transporter DctP family solute receptor
MFRRDVFCRVPRLVCSAVGSGGLRLLLAWAVLAGCGPTASDEDIIELQIGTVTAPGSLISRTSQEFVRRANERLRGRAEITFFGSSQLGTDDVMMQKLKLGTLDFTVPSTIMSSFVGEFGLFEMPYLVEDRDHRRRIAEEVFWPRIAPLAEAQGYRILAVWENGFRHITNNTRPIRVPRDLAGVKLRTPRGEWRVKLFQVFGANPTPMPLSEVFVALQTGVIDGQENPIPQIASYKFQEVQRYLSLTRHVYSPSYLATGSEHWSDLPEDVRRVIEEEARAVQEFAYSEAERMDAELLSELRASGIEINDADRGSFREASQPIYEDFAATIEGGEDMIATSLALAGTSPEAP